MSWQLMILWDFPIVVEDFLFFIQLEYNEVD
jgi:hypothetical protein